LFILRRPVIDERGAAGGISRLSARRAKVSTSPNPADTPSHQPAQPETTVADPAAQAEQAELEGRQLAEKLRQEGSSRARSIIANAEREAQAVIRSAKEAAAAAEEHAQARAAAILEGRAEPPGLDLPHLILSSQPGGVSSKISVMPPDGATLRYRIAGPMGFGALLQLKKDVSQLPGVSAVNISPSDNGEAILSLHAVDSADAWQRLQSVPSLVGVGE
jgi:hypothetical protein